MSQINLKYSGCVQHMKTRNDVYETLCPQPFTYQEGW